MGKYDAVIISEFPNDEAIAKSCCPRGAWLGNVTTHHEGFTEGNIANCPLRWREKREEKKRKEGVRRSELGADG